MRGRVVHSHTSNMFVISVTREVSQLEMSSLKFDMGLRRPSTSGVAPMRLLMSVIAETIQLEMGPYVAVAEFTSALTASIAVLSSALLVNA